MIYPGETEKGEKCKTESSNYHLERGKFRPTSEMASGKERYIHYVSYRRRDMI
jgi:hypothetical protein